MKSNPSMRRWTVIGAVLALFAGFTATAAPPAWEKLLGRRPEEWRLEHWVNSKPLTLGALRGKVVLLRWWTAPDCPFCAATAPALNEFEKTFRDRGLAVVGVYHHKSATPLVVEDVRAHAERLGFQFPVAIDPGWRTLKRWWLEAGGGGWTSVTFLLDREGRVRHIHPGGQYVKGDADYAAMKQKIEALLAEPAPVKP